MLERRAFHEFCFVLANPLQVLFDEFPPPFFAVNQDGHAGRYAGQVKLLEIADFDGTVRKVIVGRRLKEECSSPAWGFDPGGACCPPILRWIRDAKHHVFGAAVWDVKEDHGGVDGSVGPGKVWFRRPALIPIRPRADPDWTASLGSVPSRFATRPLW